MTHNILIETSDACSFGNRKNLETQKNKGKFLRGRYCYGKLIGRLTLGNHRYYNSLVQEKKAIVTDIAGNNVVMLLKSTLTCVCLPIKLIDTAGIRETVRCC